MHFYYIPQACIRAFFGYVAETALPLLTFTEKHPTPGASVIDSIQAINRQLERNFPDCTYAVVVAGDLGQPSEWVTISLDVTRESLASLDWYRERAEANGLSLTGFEPGHGTELEPAFDSRFS